MANPTGTLLLGGGHWIRSPTSLATPPAYGGTVLGTWRGLVFRIDQITQPLLAEEYGGEEVDRLYLGERIRVDAELLNWDTAGMQAAYSGAGAGAGTVPLLRYPGASLTRGEWLTDVGSVYLWAPFAATAPALLLYNAYPVLDDQGVPMSFVDELGLRASWYGVRDGSDRVWRSGLLAELSL